MKFTFSITLLLLAMLSATAQAALVFQYDATLDPGGHGVWNPNVNTSSGTRDFTLGGSTYVANAGSSYPGITSAFSFNGSAGSGGVTTGSFGTPDFLLGGAASTAAGASAAFELWFKPNQTAWDNLNTNQALFETGGGVNGFEFILTPGTGGANLNFITKQGSSIITITHFLSNNLLLNDFIQVVGVVAPGAANKTRLYLNGSLVGTDTNYVNWQNGPNAAALGRVNGGHAFGSPGQNNFNGQIALLNIYDDPLSTSDVNSSYVSITAVPEPSSMLVLGGLSLCLAGFARRRK